MSKTDKLKERKAALLEKLKALEQEEAQVQSFAKLARKKQDDRVKLLLGIVTMNYLVTNPAAKAMIGRQADMLSPSDRKFLASAPLWHELGMPIPRQEPQEGVKQATATQPATTPEKIAPAGSTQATERIAQANTMLRVSFAEKEEAKAVGAKYDADARQWYAPAGGDMARFAKWL